MKKTFLLTLLVILSTVFGVKAQEDESLAFGYCNDDVMGIGVKTAKVYYAAAIELPEATAKMYEGCQMTGVSIGFGAATAKEVTIFLTYDLAEEPFYTQTGRCLQNKFKDFDFDTPYTLEGKKVYIGYKYYCTSASAYPIGVDGSGNGVPEANNISFTQNEADLLSSWDHLSTDLGNLCIRAYLKGDKLPRYNVAPVAINAPTMVEANTDFDFDLTVSNRGTANISSLEISYTITGGESALKTVTFDTPVSSGKSAVITLPAKTTISDSSTPVVITAQVTKINGEDNASAATSVSGTVVSVKDTYKRKIVFEEFTGTGCGYCPRGYVGMEYMREHYPDDFIGIAVHTYNSTDEMYCSSYAEWTRAYVTGAPSGVLNRSGNATDPSKSNLENLLKNSDRRSLERVVLDNVEIVSDANDRKSVKFTAKTSVLNSRENATYALAFVIVQDEMGPFLQSNYYKGDSSLPEFSNLGSQTPLIFNDVARYISPAWQGIKGSVPSELVAGEEYEYENTIALNSLMTKKVAPLVIEKCRLVALLLDTTTGEIVNADRVDFPGYFTAVDGVQATGDIEILGGRGTVVVNGEFDSATVYGIDGTLRASFAAGEQPELVPGFYIVNVNLGNNTTSAKVVVK